MKHIERIASDPFGVAEARLLDPKPELEDEGAIGPLEYIYRKASTDVAVLRVLAEACEIVMNEN